MGGSEPLLCFATYCTYHFVIVTLRVVTTRVAKKLGKRAATKHLINLNRFS